MIDMPAPCIACAQCKSPQAAPVPVLHPVATSQTLMVELLRVTATASTQLPAVQVLGDDSRLLPHIQMTLILMINESLARERPCNQMVSTRSSALYALCSGEKNGFIIRLLPRRLQMLLLLLLLIQPR